MPVSLLQKARQVCRADQIAARVRILVGQYSANFLP